MSGRKAAFIGADLVEERSHCFSNEVCFRSKRELICVAKWNKSGSLERTPRLHEAPENCKLQFLDVRFSRRSTLKFTGFFLGLFRKHSLAGKSSAFT